MQYARLYAGGCLYTKCFEIMKVFFGLIKGTLSDCVCICVRVCV